MATSKSHPKAGAALAAAFVLAFCTATRATEFAGGTGEPNDPYQIATAEQLIAIGQDTDLQAEHFVLVADIDLDPNLPGGRVFDTSVLSLTSGSLDGNGHKILNFNTRYSALCAYIGPDAIIRDLTLEHASVGSAILVGENEGCVVNCSVDGIVGSASGGLAAKNSGASSMAPLY